MAQQLGSSAPFEKVQQMVRWHYQWVIVHDFLPKIVGPEMLRRIERDREGAETSTATIPQLKFFKPKKAGFIPIEFSAAAYRFGHSMVRPVYRLNQDVRRPIFANGSPDLIGFRAFPRNWAIDWRLFFPRKGARRTGTTRVQPAYKIDTSLADPLRHLHRNLVKDLPTSLAQRNRRRGLIMRLPSGQTVARAMGVEPIPVEKLKVGKPGKSIVSISKAFAGNAPLWFYILSEAQQSTGGRRLGEVGGRIVGEVFIGLLLADGDSYLRKAPKFKPLKAFLSDRGEFRMSDLLEQAQQART